MPTTERPAVPHAGYLDRLMRRQSFQALWPLFAHATKPAKEMTESFSALVHLRPHFPSVQPFRVVHVGDGAHARTGALFALKTRAQNVSIDPELNLSLVSNWQQTYGVERFTFHRSRIEDAYDVLDSLPPMPQVVSFVHAHVDVDAVLARLDWHAAFTLACCVPGRQLTRSHLIADDGEDFGVLSDERRYQVLVNARASLREAP